MPETPALDPPMALGRRVFWGRTSDGSRPITLPVIEVRSLHTDDRDLNEHGFFATLATENGVTVDLTYDPGSDDESRAMNIERGETVSLWVYVIHPSTGNRCAARIKGDEAIYDAWCGDEDHCPHEHGGWFEYVHGPEDVMDRLAHLGRLRIRAVL